MEKPFVLLHPPSANERHVVMSRFHQHSQRRKALIGGAVFAFLCVLVGSWVPVYRSYVTVASADALLAFIDRSAFHLDDQNWLLRKWIGDVYVSVNGEPTEDNLVQLEQAMSLLTRLTGHEFSIVDQKRAKFHIIFMPHDAVVETSQQFNPVSYERLIKNRQPITDLRCYAEVTYGTDENDQFYGSVYMVISTDLPQTNFRHALLRRLFLDGPEVSHHSCLMEEMMNAVGFFEDTGLLSPSAIYDYPSDQILSANDKLLIRALYDPRLKTGMARDEALIIAKHVIEELVAAYNEHGEEALYQR